jgi:threonine dehydratase
LCGAGLAVTDDEVGRAMVAAFARLKLVLEPGGAVALAAALFRGDALAPGPVIVTASGGNVDAALYADTLTRHGDSP